jgi:hypothetical protein
VREARSGCRPCRDRIPATRRRRMRSVPIGYMFLVPGQDHPTGLSPVSRQPASRLPEIPQVAETTRCSCHANHAETMGATAKDQTTEAQHARHERPAIQPGFPNRPGNRSCQKRAVNKHAFAPAPPEAAEAIETNPATIYSMTSRRVTAGKPRVRPMPDR